MYDDDDDTHQRLLFLRFFFSIAFFLSEKKAQDARQRKIYNCQKEAQNVQICEEMKLVY